MTDSKTGCRICFQPTYHDIRCRFAKGLNSPVLDSERTASERVCAGCGHDAKFSDGGTVPCSKRIHVSQAARDHSCGCDCTFSESEPRHEFSPSTDPVLYPDICGAEPQGKWCGHPRDADCHVKESVNPASYEDYPDEELREAVARKLTFDEVVALVDCPACRQPQGTKCLYKDGSVHLAAPHKSRIAMAQQFAAWDREADKIIAAEADCHVPPHSASEQAAIDYNNAEYERSQRLIASGEHVYCHGCSEAGGADRAIYHAPPVCEPVAAEAGQPAAASYYSVIRYVPDLIRDEGINIGIALQFRADPLRFRFSESFERAAAIDSICDAATVTKTITAFRQQITREAFPTLELAAQCYCGGKVQITPPRLTLATEPDAELDELFTRFIVTAAPPEPAASEREQQLERLLAECDSLLVQHHSNTMAQGWPEDATDCPVCSNTGEPNIFHRISAIRKRSVPAASEPQYDADAQCPDCDHFYEQTNFSDTFYPQWKNVCNEQDASGNGYCHCKNPFHKKRESAASEPLSLGQQGVQCNVCGFVYFGNIGEMCQSSDIKKAHEAKPRRRCFGRMFIRPLLIDADWRCCPETEEQETYIDRCIADALRSVELQTKQRVEDVRQRLLKHLDECTNSVRAQQVTNDVLRLLK